MIDSHPDTACFDPALWNAIETERRGRVLALCRRFPIYGEEAVHA